jgi:hypothetical protein
MRAPTLALLLALAGCGEQQSVRQTMASQAMHVEAAPAAVHMPGVQYAPDGDARQMKVAESAAEGPRIAYTYRFGYVLSAERLAEVQQGHVRLCDSLGAGHCRIAAMVREAGEGAYANASLTLLVDAQVARAFGDRLDAAVTGAGGSVGSRGIEAEDLSKQMVDTAARIRAKEALTERLLALLRGRNGKVGELVEAERAFATAQEELDSARSWMAEMNQRVSLSRIEIGYGSAAPVGGGLWQPIGASVADAGAVLGTSIARLLNLLVALLPWLLFAGLLWWAVRRLGWRLRLRWPRWRRPPAADAAG